MIQSAMKARAAGKNVEIEGIEELEEEIGILSWPKSILFIVGGALAIAFGGDLTVDAASRIAIDLGMSQTLVGLTIVSIGTSLPELVTSVVAARKNEVDMAVGNAVGSNIFNILMVWNCVCHQSGGTDPGEHYRYCDIDRIFPDRVDLCRNEA